MRRPSQDNPSASQVRLDFQRNAAGLDDPPGAVNECASGNAPAHRPQI